MQIECLTEPVLTTFLLCSWAVLPVKVEVIMVARCCKRMKRVGKVAGTKIIQFALRSRKHFDQLVCGRSPESCWC